MPQNTWQESDRYLAFEFGLQTAFIVSGLGIQHRFELTQVAFGCGPADVMDSTEAGLRRFPVRIRHGLRNTRRWEQRNGLGPRGSDREHVKCQGVENGLHPGWIPEP